MLTFGFPCSSTEFAFISTIPESRFPSIRAFWTRRSKMLTNTSNSLWFIMFLILIMTPTARRKLFLNSHVAYLFWISGANPKIRLRKRPTSFMSDSTIRPDIFPLPDQKWEVTSKSGQHKKFVTSVHFEDNWQNFKSKKFALQFSKICQALFSQIITHNRVPNYSNSHKSSLCFRNKIFNHVFSFRWTSGRHNWQRILKSEI